ncbi:NAD-dependent epimerase/dehydratase family protein [Alienimonas californiensis]|uniref:UDP-glucose 4-epimerase n=1 Tax=Alienimonas californiensis TaxID=2527989 RepID=A0A517P9U5_9PLAN|nr:NAD-dependent epimerase/dehydratase family protein [Alienimonas californiensis]QDT16138.1 UDP-glucose 4-epimerase [Alienimonas californiensis]
MKILVTGGAGFIGSHIVDGLLEAGHSPIVLDDLSSGSRDNLPEDVPLYVADIRDAAAVRKVFAEESPDRVCHQAAQMSVSRSVREPVFDAETNVIGLLNVCEAARGAGVDRITFASSGGALYGDVTEPAGEEHALLPIAPYGITKKVGEDYLRFYALQYGLTTVALRYGNVYGPRQNPHGEAGVVAIFARNLLSGQPITINGDGKYVRDYVHVADVAAVNVAALLGEAPRGFSAFNVGTAVGTDVNQLADAVIAGVKATRPGANLPTPVHGPPRDGDLRSSIVSPAKATAELDWEPRVTMADGIAETVAWFAENG